MAVRKPLKQFTTPLGSGAGVPKEKRPPAVHDSEHRLQKKFRVPFADQTNVLGNARISTLRVPIREARKGVKTYAVSDSTSEDIPSPPEETYTTKKKGAILPRSILHGNKLTESDSKLRRSFEVPYASGSPSRIVKGASRPPPLGTRRRIELPPRPLHDPTSEFAIVLYDPTIDRFPQLNGSISEEAVPKPPPENEQRNKRRRRDKPLADILGIKTAAHDNALHPNAPVVIDPQLAKVLRPHQVAGVKFLYRCTSGLVDPVAKGCIMADEMGLGKTLQCLTLMWTLLKQSPRGRRTIDKCIIVCPSSLVRNWANEIVKWLGEGLLTPLAVDGKSVKSSDLNQALQQWATASGRNIVRPVLIISYETLRRNVEKLAGTEVGLVLADEGHRLKNGDSLTFNALNSLRCERRVILSGTPIQNDLSEYFSLLNFANPGLLGSRNDFRKNFENAILRGRDADATDSEREKGDSKLTELSQIVSKFIIRRTNDILSKYLPVKYEYVVFIGLTPLQRLLYRHFTNSEDNRALIGSQPLKAIDLLKKLCTHPDLLRLPGDIKGCRSILPDDFNSPDSGRSKEVRVSLSAKFSVLERFITNLRHESDDKIVIISNYTKTLDLIEKLCSQRRFGCLRLDGTMNINKRQKIVDRFNDPNAPEFIFLLSSKAGGCGINLIGANRLILMDPDWNPAADQQALARVWRDGQKKDCFIYRFISTGTIEEKIFQRQSMKQSLSSCVVDNMEDVERIFSGENLRLLFKYMTDTDCETHESYKCSRCAKGGGQVEKAPLMLYGDATTWNHLNHDALVDNEDRLLKNESVFEDVSFAFQYVSH